MDSAVDIPMNTPEVVCHGYLDKKLCPLLNRFELRNLEVTGHYTIPAHHCIAWTQPPQLQTPHLEEQSMTFCSVISHVK